MMKIESKIDSRLFQFICVRIKSFRAIAYQLKWINLSLMQEFKINSYKHHSEKIAHRFVPFALLLFSFAQGCGGSGVLSPAADSGSPLPSSTPSPIRQWSGSLRLGSSAADAEGTSIARDSSGHILVAGATRGLMFGSGNVKSGDPDAFVSRYSSSLGLIWTKQFGTSPSKVTVARGVATDSSDNVIVVGYTDGALPGEGAVSGSNLVGKTDFFVRKLNSTGTLIWTRQLGVQGKSAYAQGVVIDASDNIYVAGHTDGGFGSGTSVDSFTTSSSSDYFLAKYSSTGSLTWLRLLGVATHGTYAYGIAILSSGLTPGVFITGATTGGLVGYSKTGSGSDYFIARYNLEGTRQWLAQGGVSNGSAEAYSIAVDSSGVSYIVGATSAEFSSLSQTGTIDYFVAKHGSDGIRTAIRQYGVVGASAWGYGLTQASDGSLYVAGGTNGGLNGQTLSGTHDSFLTKINPSDLTTVTWTRLLGAPSSYTVGRGLISSDSGTSLSVFVVGKTNANLSASTQGQSYSLFIAEYNGSGERSQTEENSATEGVVQANSIARDASNRLVIVGSAQGGLNDNMKTGLTDAFVTQYDSLGDHQWTKQLGASNGQTLGTAVAIDEARSKIYVAGTTTGGLPGQSLVGVRDAFLSQYSFSGERLWVKQLGVAAKITRGLGVAVDSDGYAYVTGTTTGSLPSPRPSSSITGLEDFYVARYSDNGNLIWTRQGGVSEKSSFSYAIVTTKVVSDTGIYVSGSTDGGFTSYGNTLTGDRDGFLAQLNSSGDIVGIKQFGVSNSVTEANSIAADSSGNVYLTGYSSANLATNSLNSNSRADVFVTRYDADGNRNWMTMLAASGGDSTAYGITLGSLGSVLLTGFTAGTFPNNTKKGSYDFFLSKLSDSDGAHEWTHQLGVSGAEAIGSAVCTDSSHNIFAAGYSNGAFDGNSLIGHADSFVVKYNSAGVKQ